MDDLLLSLPGLALIPALIFVLCCIPFSLLSADGRHTWPILAMIALALLAEIAVRSDFRAGAWIVLLPLLQFMIALHIRREVDRGSHRLRFLLLTGPLCYAILLSGFVSLGALVFHHEVAFDFSRPGYPALASTTARWYFACLGIGQLLLIVLLLYLAAKDTTYRGSLAWWTEGPRSMSRLPIVYGARIMMLVLRVVRPASGEPIKNRNLALVLLATALVCVIRFALDDSIVSTALYAFFESLVLILCVGGFTALHSLRRRADIYAAALICAVCGGLAWAGAYAHHRVYLQKRGQDFLIAQESTADRAFESLPSSVYFVLTRAAERESHTEFESLFTQNHEVNLEHFVATIREGNHLKLRTEDIAPTVANEITGRGSLEYAYLVCDGQRYFAMRRFVDGHLYLIGFDYDNYRNEMGAVTALMAIAMPPAILVILLGYLRIQNDKENSPLK